MSKFIFNLLSAIIVVILLLTVIETTLRITSVSDTKQHIIATNDSRNFDNKPGDEYVSDDVLYKTNSDGIRADKEYTPTNKTRIIVLGDSVTFGTYLPFNETFAQKIQQILPKTEVINLAVPSYNTYLEIEQLKIKGLKYNPKIVVLSFMLDDIEPAETPFKNTVSNQICLLPIINLKVSCQLKNAIRNIRLVTFFYNKISDKFSENLGDHYEVTWANPALYETNILAPMKQLKQICTEKNITCLVAIQPLLKFNSTYYKWQNLDDQIIKDLDELRLSHITIRNSLENRTPEEIGWPNRDLLHFNQKGNEIIAQATAEKIKEAIQ